MRLFLQTGCIGSIYCLIEDMAMQRGEVKVTNYPCRIMTRVGANTNGYDFFTASASVFRFARPSMTAFNEPLA